MIQKNQLILLICILLIVPLITVFVGLTKISKKISTLTQNQKVNRRERYQSKILQFSVEIPNYFHVQDESLTINFISSKGTITIIRNGTNFNTLYDYIKEFDSRRRIKIVSTEKKSINGYESIFRTIEFPAGKSTQRSDYIYINNWVYILSTSSKNLYSDLDQIAQSFKYSP